MSILAPIYQCCLIRQSTLRTLLSFVSQPGGRLSKRIRKSMSNDAVAPVLLEGHLEALDRRVHKILDVVGTCLKTKPSTDVIIFDEFL